MRGKKANPEFISSFIAKCVAQGMVTSEQMLEAARAEIQAIDDKIKEVELLKANRSKLLDVIHNFSKVEDKEEEAKLLPFFKLQYSDTCKKICDLIKEMPFELDPDYSGMTEDPVFAYCIKQLIEAGIATRVDSRLVRGEKFNDYLKFVLREVE